MLEKVYRISLIFLFSSIGLFALSLVFLVVFSAISSAMYW